MVEAIAPLTSSALLRAIAHGWCIDTLERYGLPRPNARRHRGIEYIRRLEQTVVAAESGHIPKGQYGAVMVDEGHDFAPEWRFSWMVTEVAQAILVQVKAKTDLLSRQLHSRRLVNWTAHGTQRNLPCHNLIEATFSKRCAL